MNVNIICSLLGFQMKPLWLDLRNLKNYFYFIKTTKRCWGKGTFLLCSFFFFYSFVRCLFTMILLPFWWTISFLSLLGFAFYYYFRFFMQDILIIFFHLFYLFPDPFHFPDHPISSSLSLFPTKQNKTKNAQTFKTNKKIQIGPKRAHTHTHTSE